MVDRAISLLDAKPMTLTVTTGLSAQKAGHPINVVFDGATLLRMIRATLTKSGGASIGTIPRLVQQVLDGHLQGDDPAVVLLAGDDGYCVGFEPRCETAPALGVDLTIICRDLAPFAEQAAVAQSSEPVDEPSDVFDEPDPGFADLFGHNPHLAACPIWDVPVDPTVAEPIANDVPLFVEVGRFDPFEGPIGDVRAALKGMSRLAVLDIPTMSYNVFGEFECPRTFYIAWICPPWRGGVRYELPDRAAAAQFQSVPVRRRLDRRNTVSPGDTGPRSGHGVGVASDGSESARGSRSPATR